MNRAKIKGEVIMRRFSVILLLLAVFAISSAFAQTWLTGSIEEAQAKAKASGKPILVDFFVETG
jgi:hypothetical protein